MKYCVMAERRASAPYFKSQHACTSHAHVPLGQFLDHYLRKTGTSGSLLATALVYILRLQDAVKQNEANRYAPYPATVLQLVGFGGAGEGTVCLHRCSNCSSSRLIVMSRPYRTAERLPTRCRHCLFTSVIVLAFKYVRDDPYRNTHFARWAGVSLQELNFLEISFLKFLGFRMHVPRDQLEHVAKAIFSAPLAANQTLHSGLEHLWYACLPLR
jgi:hypothetical protein